MPKRFTATEKWLDPWFRGLPVEYKAFWLFICDHCDNAGVWKVDIELAEYLLKFEVVMDKALDLFSERVTLLEKGHILINKFVEFQYGNLSKDCKPHTHVIGLIRKHRVSKGYPKGINTLEEKDKDKEVLDVREGMGGVEKKQHLGWFEEIWSRYPKRKGKEKSKEGFLNSVKTEQDLESIKQALANYLSSKRVMDGYAKDAERWFRGNEWRSWIDFKEESQPIGGRPAWMISTRKA